MELNSLLWNLYAKKEITQHYSFLTHILMHAQMTGLRVTKKYITM